MKHSYIQYLTSLAVGLIILAFIYSPLAAQDTYTDIDGNVYETVTIGDRVWLTENLRVKSFNNGDPIPYIEVNADWATDSRDNSQPAYTFFNNDSTNIETFGYLYNHFVITDSRGIASDDWRVPNEDDWKALEVAAGMSESNLDRNGWAGAAENVAGKLKSSDVVHWDSNEATSITNELEFSWVGGSVRYAYGAFEAPVSKLRFSSLWSADDFAENTDRAWRRFARFDSSSVRRSPVPKATGMSIRLVKDATATSNESGLEQPKEIGLSQNYPNPFNPTTSISFNLPEATDVTLSVYNMLGQKVAVLLNGPRTAGEHTIAFDASSLSSGVYMYRLKSGSMTIMKKMTLLK